MADFKVNLWRFHTECGAYTYECELQKGENEPLVSLFIRDEHGKIILGDGMYLGDLNEFIEMLQSVRDKQKEKWGVGAD